MKLSRRSLLLGAGALAGASYLYMNDEPMARPKGRKSINGKAHILADFHCHLSASRAKDDPNALTELLSDGMTALTTGMRGYLSYGQALDICRSQGAQYKEIDAGLLAKISYRDNIGYIVKSQEAFSTHHVVAIGNTFPINPYNTPENIIRLIKNQGAIPILAHPYILPGDGWPKGFPHVATKHDENRIEYLAGLATEIESFSSVSTNALPNAAGWLDLPISTMWLARKANERAEMLAKRIGKKGIAVSDTHGFFEQARISGIYIPEDEISLEGIKGVLQEKRFIPERNYVSRYSVISSIVVRLPFLQ